MQFVLKMDIDEPIEQHDSHMFSYVRLLVKVVIVDRGRSYLAEKELQDLFFINQLLTLSFFFYLKDIFVFHLCVNGGFFTESIHTLC